MQTNRRVETPEAAFTCVALLETSAGAELHMRDGQGRLLRLPLRDADQELRAGEQSHLGMTHFVKFATGGCNTKWLEGPLLEPLVDRFEGHG